MEKREDNERRGERIVSIKTWIIDDLLGLTVVFWIRNNCFEDEIAVLIKESP